MLDLIRSGAWLSVRRRKAWCLIAGTGFTAAFLFLALTSTEGVDFMGRPLGADFLNVWAAGQLVLQGAPQDAYDYAAHSQMEWMFFPSLATYFGWHYPPPFLLVAGLLARLPYVAALFIWMALTFLGLAWAAKGLRFDRVSGLAFPALFVNFANGQNGLLSAALMLGGLRFLDQSPWLAGAILGVLSFKPQLGLVLPFALAAAGSWRAFAGAAFSSLAIALLSWLALGSAPWQAFFDSLAVTQQMVMEGDYIKFGKMQGVFAAVRMWGAGAALAWGVQSVCTLAALVLVWRLWRHPCLPLGDRSLALVLATCLATPYLYDYDLAVLAAPLVLKAQEGRFRPWEISFFALLWALPLLARPFGMWLHVPLTPLAAILGLWLLHSNRLPHR